MLNSHCMQQCKKEAPPSVPSKSEELVEYLHRDSTFTGEVPTQLIPADSEYTGLPSSPSRMSHKLVNISNPEFGEMESNPMYQNNDQLNDPHTYTNVVQENISNVIYTTPDITSSQKDETYRGNFDVEYSEPIQPSLFTVSETDDDKNKSMLVAVKKLKSGAPSTTKEAFEKEVNFMSRLDDSNVIRILGVCHEDTPFIMMEYMEKGDLNHYLQKFKELSTTDSEPQGQITTSTLVHMTTQIASAMKYLASHNFVHRDLAT